MKDKTALKNEKKISAEKPIQKKEHEIKIIKPNKKFLKKTRRREFLKLQKKREAKKAFYRKAQPEKKARLAKSARQTKWAPVWVVLKKFGPGKRVHPSAITRYRRSWRRTKLKLKPRKMKISHYG